MKPSLVVEFTYTPKDFKDLYENGRIPAVGSVTNFELTEGEPIPFKVERVQFKVLLQIKEEGGE